MTGPQIAADLRVIVGVAFLLAGLLKRSGSISAQSSLLEAVGIERNDVRRLLVRGLPALEVGLGLWLLTGWRATQALGAAACLFLTFALVLSRALMRGYEGSCGCFGSETGRVGVSSLVFDLLLLFVAGAALGLHVMGGAEAADSVVHAETADLLVIVFVGLWLFAANIMMRKIEEVARMLAELEYRRRGPGPAAV